MFAKCTICHSFCVRFTLFETFFFSKSELFFLLKFVQPTSENFATNVISIKSALVKKNAMFSKMMNMKILSIKAWNQLTRKYKKQLKR